jgi:hypothetical protein
MRTEKREHPPCAGGRLERAVIIYHDTAAIPKPKRAPPPVPSEDPQ